MYLHTIYQFGYLMFCIGRTCLLQIYDRMFAVPSSHFDSNIGAKDGSTVIEPMNEDVDKVDRPVPISMLMQKQLLKPHKKNDPHSRCGTKRAKESERMGVQQSRQEAKAEISCFTLFHITMHVFRLIFCFILYIVVSLLYCLMIYYHSVFIICLYTLYQFLYYLPVYFNVCRYNKACRVGSI